VHGKLLAPPVSHFAKLGSRCGIIGQGRRIPKKYTLRPNGFGAFVLRGIAWASDPDGGIGFLRRFSLLVEQLEAVLGRLLRLDRRMDVCPELLAGSILVGISLFDLLARFSVPPAVSRRAFFSFAPLTRFGKLGHADYSLIEVGCS
jgi:hypothetical protein